jgi:hypothetical protein
MPENVVNIQISDALKEKLAKAKTPVWKKVLWWTLGGLLVILSVIGVLYVWRRKGPVEGVKVSVEQVKQEISKSDLEAKIKVAEAEKAEQAVIDKLKEIKEIDDEKRRLEELNKLL